ncbi:MAG TPA: DUF6537 domain-containing protein, partial [Streptosporangiaceae bacterium]
GIGGTGVVTLSQLLATAAFLDGLQVTGLDQTGLSQKAGPVVSHLKLWDAAAVPDPQASSAVGEESADLLLALDLLVAADPKQLVRASADRTVTVASTSLVPTAGMVRGDTGAPDAEGLAAAVQEHTRPGQFTSLDTVALATALFGDSVAANLIALGAAYQAGAVPLQAASITRAIELNGVAVERNGAAFQAGRLAVHDPGRLPASRRAGELRREPDARQLAPARELAAARGLDGAVAERPVRHAAELIAYQNDRLAARYLDLVSATARAESGLAVSSPAETAPPSSPPGQAGELTGAVAEAFFKLLAYKDEYEVARLHLLPEFDQAVAQAVSGGRSVKYLLHPPVLRALGMQKKIAFPAPVIRPAFRVLRSMRHLRGTAADPFGYTEVRRTERRLAAGYEAELRGVLDGLSAATLPAAVELARLPLDIRGYEQIKLAAVERYERELERLRPLARGNG